MSITLQLESRRNHRWSRTVDVVSCVLVLTLAVSFMIVAVDPSRALAVFPGTNGRIVFISEGPFRDEWAINTMKPDGSGLETRIINFGVLPDPPVYSPDGSKIVYATWRPDFSYINIINAEGSHQRRTVGDLFFRNHDPSWSPDGSRIVFASDRNDPNADGCWQDNTCNYDIFVMPATGEPARQLTFGGGNDRRPRFSPDGRLVAFHSYVDGVSAIYTVNVETLEITKLTSDSLQAAEPNWSPDGTQITFVNNYVSSCPDKLKTCFSDIFVMNADGGSITQLTRDFGNNLHPAWSPQGDRIVFAHSNNAKLNQKHLFIMNADGTGITRITHETHNNRYPDWGSG